MLSKFVAVSAIVLSFATPALAQCPDCTIPVPRPPVSGPPSCQVQAVRVYRAEAKEIGKSKAEYNYRRTIARCRKTAIQQFPAR